MKVAYKIYKTNWDDSGDVDIFKRVILQNEDKFHRNDFDTMQECINFINENPEYFESYEDYTILPIITK